LRRFTRRIGIVDQGQQQVFERRILVAAFIRVRHRAVQSLREDMKMGAWEILSVFSIVHCRCWWRRRLDHLGDAVFGVTTS
jgi:hypothetical protein